MPCPEFPRFRLALLPAFLLLFNGWGAAAPQEAPAAPPLSVADLVNQIRSAGLDPAACYRVRDLSLVKEDLKLYFTDGYLIFSKPAAGERFAAVFSADVDGGDGEVLLLPPYRGERQSLAKFTHSANLDEHFSAAVLLLTGGSAQALLDQITRENVGRAAPEMGPVLASQWSPVLENMADGFELRLAGDLLTPPASRTGLLFASVAGKRLGNFDLYYDANAQEQIAAGQLVERGGQPAYDIWTSFAARSHRSSGAAPPPRRFTASHYRIDAALDAGLSLKASDHIDIAIGPNPERVLPFEIFRGAKISSAKIDGAPAEILFHDSVRGRALRDGGNDPFLLVAPHILAPGSKHQIDLDEEGAVIIPAGPGVDYVNARANWYPRGGADLATYDLAFRYPKQLTLVTAGEIAEDRVDGDWRYTRRVTPAPMRLAGFNLGDYEKIAGSAAGMEVEVYGNRRLETALQPKPQLPEQETEAQARLRPRPRRGGTNLPIEIVPAPPDPAARLRAVAADVSASLEYFSGLFGPPGLKRLTVAPIPGNFGQGFPGLIYLSTLAYLDPAQRPPALRGAVAQTFYSDLIEAHEVAHQWWGDRVIAAGYQDEWLPEALANYSALMFLQKKKGTRAMETVLAQYRDGLLKKPSNDGSTLESAGPLTWGYRLESAGPPDAWRAITYDKGSWILAMLRSRLGDSRFIAMLADLRRRYDERAVSTADFRDLVKQFRPPRVSASDIDEFFDNWVYSTGIPTLGLHYSVKGSGSSLRVSGRIDQRGVDDNFSAQVPVEIQFARGAPQTVWVHTSNDGAEFSAAVKSRPVRVSIPEAGVLAVLVK